MSVSSSAPTIVAAWTRPWESVTTMESAPRTTCSLVIREPRSSMANPDPYDLRKRDCGVVLPRKSSNRLRGPDWPTRRMLMLTTEGATRRAASTIGV